MLLALCVGCDSVPEATPSASHDETRSAPLLPPAPAEPAPVADVRVVYPSDADTSVLLAAKELRRYIYLRTGELTPLEAVEVLPAAGELIVVAPTDSSLLTGLQVGVPAGGYALHSRSEGARELLLVVGADSGATLHAAYRYAALLGVGFDLAGDAIPDARIELDITGIDELGAPRFSTRGIQPFHDFFQGPDLWNEDDYLLTIGQLPKLGLDFVGLHTYPRWSTTEEKDNTQ